MQSRAPSGITLIEVMVACVVVLTLILLIANFTSRVPERMFRGQVLGNMKQIHMATQAMTIDNAESGGPISYTCRNRRPMTMAELKESLVQGGYMSAEEWERYLGYYVRGMLGFKRDMGEAFDLFAVNELDAGSTLFAVTKNWHGFPSGTLSGEPYGVDGFVAFQMCGSGAILQPKNATDEKVIGTGGRHNYLRLK